jgi:hypothetical protein
MPFRAKVGIGSEAVGNSGEPEILAGNGRGFLVVLFFF